MLILAGPFSDPLGITSRGVEHKILAPGVSPIIRRAPATLCKWEQATKGFCHPALHKTPQETQEFWIFPAQREGMSVLTFAHGLVPF